MFKNVLVPRDGSALAGRAVDAGIALARVTGARLTAVTVIEPFHVFAFNPDHLGYSLATYLEHARAEAARILQDVADRAATAGIACATLRREADHPHDAIIEVAHAEGCDVIAMASHGRRGIAAVLLGSVTQKILTHATIPVLVYR